jgi:serine/threonine-protein kinase HipA
MTLKKYKGKKLDLSSLETSPQMAMEDALDSKYATFNKCLYCYEKLVATLSDFHETCNKKFFGQLQTPLLDYKFDDLDALADKIITSKMAVTGVQAKLSLSIQRKNANNTIKKLTIVGLYGNYILKPPSKYYEQLPEVEDVTMHLAALCGLPTVPHSLVKLSDDTLCYITKRVDRYKQEKLHMEDMCQLTERLTEDKYKGSHEQVAKTILKYSDTPLLDVVKFYELVLFSFLTGNADMHLKNFSLLEQNNKFTLCPAYDMLATALVNKADKEELALTLNGKKSRLKYHDFVTAFENSNLNQKVLDNALAKFYTAKNKMFACVDSSFLSQNLKDEYKTLLTERFARLLLY